MIKHLLVTATEETIVELSTPAAIEQYKRFIGASEEGKIELVPVDNQNGIATKEIHLKEVGHIGFEVDCGNPKQLKWRIFSSPLESAPA